MYVYMCIFIFSTFRSFNSFLSLRKETTARRITKRVHSVDSYFTLILYFLLFISAFLLRETYGSLVLESFVKTVGPSSQNTCLAILFSARIYIYIREERGASSRDRGFVYSAWTDYIYDNN